MAAKRVREAIKATSKHTIYVVAADLNEPDSQVRGLFKRSQEVRYARVPISAEQLSSQLREFFKTIDGTLSDIPQNVGKLSLDAVTLTVEISAKGTVSLLGTGGEIAGKGGLTFTLKRQTPDA